MTTAKIFAMKISIELVAGNHTNAILMRILADIDDYNYNGASEV